MSEIPAVLVAAFAEKVTIGGRELCRLLPMDAKTLKRHCAFGSISYTQTGFGVSAPKRFTLAQVMKFLDGQSRTESSSFGRTASYTGSRSSGAAPLGLLARMDRGSAVEPKGFLEMAAQYHAERDRQRHEKQRDYLAGLARDAELEAFRSSQRADALETRVAGDEQSLLAKAERTRARQEANARKREAQALARAAKVEGRLAARENRPVAGEDHGAWKRRLAAERAQRVVERRQLREYLLKA